MTDRLYQIVLEPPAYSLKDALVIHGLKLSKVIVDKVTYAIDNDLDEIDVAEIVSITDIITLKSSRKFFIETLEYNMKNLIQNEEYEYCARCKEYLDILKKEN